MQTITMTGEQFAVRCDKKIEDINRLMSGDLEEQVYKEYHRFVSIYEDIKEVALNSFISRSIDRHNEREQMGFIGRIFNKEEPHCSIKLIPTKSELLDNYTIEKAVKNKIFWNHVHIAIDLYIIENKIDGFNMSIEPYLFENLKQQKSYEIPRSSGALLDFIESKKRELFSKRIDMAGHKIKYDAEEIVVLTQIEFDTLFVEDII